MTHMHLCPLSPTLHTEEFAAAVRLQRPDSQQIAMRDCLEQLDTALGLVHPVDLRLVLPDETPMLQQALHTTSQGPSTNETRLCKAGGWPEEDEEHMLLHCAVDHMLACPQYAKTRDNYSKISRLTLKELFTREDQLNVANFAISSST